MGCVAFAHRRLSFTCNGVRLPRISAFSLHFVSGIVFRDAYMKVNTPFTVLHIKEHYFLLFYKYFMKQSKGIDSIQ